MIESLSVEKRITTLEKKNSQEERKSKKVSFKDDSKKKPSKDPFDVEGLQKFLKTMTNAMADIKKQVIESYSLKRTFRPFNKIQSYNSHPPNIISNVESDQDIDEEKTKEVEVNGMWDFILPNQEQKEDLPVSTRRKILLKQRNQINNRRIQRLLKTKQ